MDVHRLLGREEEMRWEFQHLAAQGFSRLPIALRQASLAHLARAWAFLGDRERAAQLAELLLPYAGRNLVSRAGPEYLLGAASFYLALLTTTLERWPEAAEHFEVAIAMHGSIRARSLLAETEYEFAAMRATRKAPGDREKALDLLNSDIAATREMGMNPLLEKALSLKLQLQGLLKA